MTVEKDGSPTIEYQIYLNFNLQNDTIIGSSAIIYKNLNAHIIFVGQTTDYQTLTLTETEIIRADTLPNNGEWCLKKISLHKQSKDNQIIYEGRWTGNTSFSTCTPGKIWIKKSIPRP